MGTISRSNGGNFGAPEDDWDGMLWRGLRLAAPTVCFVSTRHCWRVWRLLSELRSWQLLLSVIRVDSVASNLFLEFRRLILGVVSFGSADSFVEMLLRDGSSVVV